MTNFVHDSNIFYSCAFSTIGHLDELYIVILVVIFFFYVRSRIFEQPILNKLYKSFAIFICVYKFVEVIREG